VRTVLLSLLLVACRSNDKADTTDVTVDTADLSVVDADGDGYTAEDGDCDDNNSLVHPGAEELCDGADNNCDGEVDEEVLTTFYADEDGDGFGDPEAVAEACEAPEGYTIVANDCDDEDPDSYPAAPERCDERDNDCDGEVDEDVQTEWHADADGDSYGDPDSIIEDCDPPEGYVANTDDCDDLNGTAYPGAEEVCDEADNDCDGAVDEDVTTTYYQDTDGDGFGVSDQTTEACTLPNGYADITGDCDDTDGAVSPNATELCDSIDNDCDGTVDEDDAADAPTWHDDSDGDGYGDPTDTTVACDQPSGYTSDNTDCDDASADANPGAAEVCDEADNDCDGEVDEDSATDAATWYADNDGDGYGGSSTTAACDQPSGFADNSDDCNDSNADANPGASEVCDEVDNDCDGDTDEGVTTTYYLDFDGDGYGGSGVSTDACAAPSSYVTDSTDCDDTESTVNPAASEVCDGLDNDCDGLTDDDDSSVDTSTGATFYTDGDGDGYGDASDTTVACDAPSGTVTDDSDCDDTDSAINPGASEVCDAADNDCDGLTDDDDSSVDTATGATFYTDDDGDGYGDAGDATAACEQPSGTVSDSADCDDSDSAINPAASEVCDEVDNDCDGDIDDDDSSLDTSTGSTFYADDDGDGYGDAGSSVLACEQPSAYTDDDTDCDDSSADANPMGDEACNGADDDCDGTVDNGVLGTGDDCPAADCEAILADDSSAADGTFTLEGLSGDTFETHCNMTDDSGGWTFIGSIVNDGTRSWNSYDAWTDESTFGDLADRQAEDVRSQAFYDTEGDDFLVVTDEYSFAFYALVGEIDFAEFVANEYNATVCQTSFLASGADWSDGLTAAQESLHSFIVRPWDNNASCFPSGNENTIIGMQLSSCCWVNGLGNTPNGQASWEVYDLSLLELSRLTGSTCTSGSYPCNDAGYYNSGTNGYTSSTKVTYAEVYVR